MGAVEAPQEMHARMQPATEGLNDTGVQPALDKPPTERETGGGRLGLPSLGGAARLLSYLVLGLLSGVLLLVALATTPVLFGFHLYRIDGSTATPAAGAGNAVVAKATDPQDLEVGDAIALPETADGPSGFQRIVEVVFTDGERRFVTDVQQDAVPAAEPIILDDPVDRMVYAVPLAGYLLGYAQSFNLLAVGIALFALSVFFLRERLRSLRRQRTAADEPAEEAEPTPPPAKAPPATAPAGRTNTLSILLEDAPGLHALMEVERALAELPMAERADLVRCQEGSAALALVLSAPVGSETIVGALRSAGHDAAVEEARTDTMELRLRYLAPAGDSGVAALAASDV